MKNGIVPETTEELIGRIRGDWASLVLRGTGWEVSVLTKEFWPTYAEGGLHGTEIVIMTTGAPRAVEQS